MDKSVLIIIPTRPYSMTISLLHPSRNRATQAGATMCEWMGRSSGLHSIEYIISLDDSDGQLAEYHRIADRHSARLVIRPNRNSVQACNQAALVAAGDLLIMFRTTSVVRKAGTTHLPGGSVTGATSQFSSMTASERRP